ncbi:unnamed protein product [Arabis nemorensis]|uniref:Uncharacterized protein n=1 Tax=Arabis nemorensis TaxID=586526 RepID=A0A565CBH8_9BRAS|nr:unnamed protein product [Arabis nemorensis]
MRTSLAFSCSLIIIILLLSQPLPISSEIQESKPQTLTSWERSLAQQGESNPSDPHDSLRVFMRKARVGGVGGKSSKKSKSRHPVIYGGSGGTSATTRPCLSIAFRFGSTVTSSILLILFAFY